METDTSHVHLDPEESDKYTTLLSLKLQQNEINALPWTLPSL
jgi:hypothetical protein